MERQRAGELVVGDAVAAKEQQLRLAGIHRREHGADPALLLRGREQLVRGLRRTSECQQLFITGAPGPAPQFIERQTDRGPVQPSAGRVAMRLRMLPQPPERLDGELLRPRRVADHPDDRPRNAAVVREKDGLEVEGPRSGAEGRRFYHVTWCVHRP